MAITPPHDRPSPTDLRAFALLQGVFWGGVGWVLLQQDMPRAAVLVLWLAAAAATGAGLARPAAIKGYYRTWMFAVAPVGWVVSHLLMAVIYFTVVTPLGWWRRTYLGDPLKLRWDRKLPSYWEEHRRRRDPKEYFRPF